MGFGPVCFPSVFGKCFTFVADISSAVCGEVADVESVNTVSSEFL